MKTINCINQEKNWRIQLGRSLLLFEWRYPPIIWMCGGDRQRISSNAEGSCVPAMSNCCGNEEISELGIW
jgi:hypothetical protein